MYDVLLFCFVTFSYNIFTKTVSKRVILNTEL